MLYDEGEVAGWAAVLERRFIAAAQSEEAYVAAARKARREAIAWIADGSTAKGSFMWVCDLLGLEPDAVRRALRTEAVDQAAREAGL